MINDAKKLVLEQQNKLNDSSKAITNDRKVEISNVKVEQEHKNNVKNLLNNLTTTQKEQALEQIRRRKARENYFEYWKYCYPHYYPTNFHRYLCHICDAVIKRVEKANMPNATDEDIARGRIRLLISVPCQHGKSDTITKCLPSWFIGRNPTKHAILTAYNAELAEKFEDSNREKTRSIGKEIFGVEISESQDNKQEYTLKSGGGVMGAGILGGLTGNPAQLIIIDDPYKSGLEANSPATRKQIEDIFRDSIYTRIGGKGNAVIVIQTRWHENDLCGWLGKQVGWITINIPCVCEDEEHDQLHRKLGQTLCPELGFDTQWVIDKQRIVGKKVWEALYQGHPYIDGGEIFTRNMIKQYTSATLPANFDEQVISCDLSFGGTKKANDPCAIQVWGRVGANHYLLHRIKKKMGFNDMCEQIKILSATYPQAKRKIIEKKANGQAVIDSLNSVIGGFEAYDPKMESKVSRANACIPYFESGNVFLPSQEIDLSIDDMIDELMKFPNGEHDDEVDALTQYLCCYNYKYNGKLCSGKYFAGINSVLRGFKI